MDATQTQARRCYAVVVVEVQDTSAFVDEAPPSFEETQAEGHSAMHGPPSVVQNVPVFPVLKTVSYTWAGDPQPAAREAVVGYFSPPSSVRRRVVAGRTGIRAPTNPFERHATLNPWVSASCLIYSSSSSASATAPAANPNPFNVAVDVEDEMHAAFPRPRYARRHSQQRSLCPQENTYLHLQDPAPLLGTTALAQREWWAGFAGREDLEMEMEIGVEEDGTEEGAEECAAEEVAGASACVGRAIREEARAY
ncbi:hypothetical protein DFH09DRAFT_1106905 [Mycena vulgaris]|nr:hypothetical protein DFH09DRAFT_1106905 [Mycena vulgaris]